MTEAVSTTAVPTPSWTVASTQAEACNQPLGMVSGAIADSQLTASSAQPGYEAFKARINGTRSWHMAQLDTQQWLQVDLGQLKIVTGIQTQGKWGGRVTSYRLLFHGQDMAGNWTAYTQLGGGQVLEGNSDGDSIVQHDLHVPMVTRYMRVNPVTWPGVLPRLRMELLGCNIYPDCYHPLGKEDGGITESQGTASSSVPGYQAWQGPIHGPRAWQPKDPEQKAVVQLDLLQATRVYDGNQDRGYVVRHTLATPVVTRYLRFYPEFLPDGPPRLRLEVLGCTGRWKPTPLPLATTESHVTSLVSRSQSSTSTPTTTSTASADLHTTAAQTALPTALTTVVPPDEISPSQSTSTARKTTVPAQPVTRSTTKASMTESTTTTLRVTDSRTTGETARSSTASTIFHSVTASTIFHSATLPTKSTPKKKTMSPIVKVSTKGTITKDVYMPTSTFKSSTRERQDYTTRKITTEKSINDGTTQLTFTERKTMTGKSLNKTDEFRSTEKRDKQRSAQILYITVGVIGGVAVLAGFITLVACSRAKSVTESTRGLLGNDADAENLAYQTL
uniref:F5/8 type C domain-containing protein n=1 Tax=Branchiostoma floridae TaxID=7739 RepID=C3YM36_BRAFL|eukprot:XP_002602618.1 hypothetical protein BRAFLDRAFT_81900 [Branchiostoma floridae]